jgi:hypothetical protein
MELLKPLSKADFPAQTASFTATAASTPIPAQTPIPFAVPITVSGVWRVSAIRVATDGVVYCKPINKA